MCLLGICHLSPQDLESKALVDELNVDRLSTPAPVECVSLSWSNDGQTLFAGQPLPVSPRFELYCVVVCVCNYF